MKPRAYLAVNNYTKSRYAHFTAQYLFIIGSQPVPQQGGIYTFEIYFVFQIAVLQSLPSRAGRWPKCQSPPAKAGVGSSIAV